MQAVDEFVLFECDPLSIGSDVYNGKVISISRGINNSSFISLGVGVTIYVDKTDSILIKDNIYACKFYHIIAIE